MRIFFFLASKIHCSKECEKILQKSGGYHFLERGFISVKGKGQLQTYFLVGEDTDMKQRRDEERTRIRASKTNLNCTDQLDVTHYLLPKSSLKNRASSKSPISRCSSFESPKKLRFASFENLESTLCKPCPESPTKSNASNDNLSENQSDIWKTASSSCPCIEIVVNSSATLNQFQLTLLGCDDASKAKMAKFRAFCASVPSLKGYLNAPKLPIFHAISAPASPRRQEKADRTASRNFDYEETVPWLDSNPLVTITGPKD